MAKELVLEYTPQMAREARQSLKGIADPRVLAKTSDAGAIKWALQVAQKRMTFGHMTADLRKFYHKALGILKRGTVSPNKKKRKPIGLLKHVTAKYGSHHRKNKPKKNGFLEKKGEIYVTIKPWSTFKRLSQPGEKWIVISPQELGTGLFTMKSLKDGTRYSDVPSGMTEYIMPLKKIKGKYKRNPLLLVAANPRKGTSKYRGGYEKNPKRFKVGDRVVGIAGKGWYGIEARVLFVDPSGTSMRIKLSEPLTGRVTVSTLDFKVKGKKPRRNEYRGGYGKNPDTKVIARKILDDLIKRKMYITEDTVKGSYQTITKDFPTRIELSDIMDEIEMMISRNPKRKSNPFVHVKNPDIVVRVKTKAGKWKTIKRPRIGERINTEYGLEEVIRIIPFEEATRDMPEEVKKRVGQTAKMFLGKKERYFEFMTRLIKAKPKYKHAEGEYDQHDWSEYPGNF